MMGTFNATDKRISAIKQMAVVDKSYFCDKRGQNFSFCKSPTSVFSNNMYKIINFRAYLDKGISNMQTQVSFPYKSYDSMGAPR